MKRAAIILTALCILLFLAVLPGASEKEPFQIRKDPELQQIRPKKPVKIKLRRTAKDGYTWELTGDDADEIIRTDKKLRKMLNAQ